MGIHDFKYPIMPDRVYTIRSGDTDVDVYGDILIAAYLLYKDTEIPFDISPTDIHDRLF